MKKNLSKEIISKLNTLGFYQIGGGVIGLGLTVWIISGLASITGLLLLLLLIAIALYGYSIYCGILLLKKQISGLRYSVLNQILQIVSFSIFGFAFQYVSGIHLSIGLDLTDSFNFIFNVGISSWQITVNGDSQALGFSFNLVALFLIFWIEKLKSKMEKEQIEKQIESIAQ
jgi:hypothetical protein